MELDEPKQSLFVILCRNSRILPWQVGTCGSVTVWLAHGTLPTRYLHYAMATSSVRYYFVHSTRLTTSGACSPLRSTLRSLMSSWKFPRGLLMRYQLG